MKSKWRLPGWWLIAGFALTGHGSESAPSGLLCELLRWPDRTVITNPQPSFTWIVPGQAGQRQTGFQIQVATARTDFGESKVLFWDSGHISAATSSNVRYSGPPLSSRQTYHWRVRVWQEKDRRPTQFSEAQTFRTGDLSLQHNTPTLPLVETIVAPVQLTVTTGESCVVDFGRTAFGYLLLDYRDGRASTTTLRYGEKLVNGQVDMNAGASIRSGTVLLPADYTGWIRVPFVDPPRPAAAMSLPEKTGVVVPFRYVEMSPVGSWTNPDCYSMRMVHYPFVEDESSFHSSDKKLNSIWDLCKYTIKATSFAGIYVDGDRERIPYEADAYINQLGHYYVDREFALARHSHEFLLEHPTWPTEWGFHSIFMAWADYWYTGNRDSLLWNYEKLKAKLPFARVDQSSGLLRGFPGPLGAENTADLVDWPAEERDGYVFSAYSSVINAFFYRSLVLMEHIAQVLAREEDARFFGERARVLRLSYRQAFFDATTSLFVDGKGIRHSSLHANLFPLAFGLVEGPERPSIVAYLKKRGMAGSVYAAQYLLEGLFVSGESAAALALMTDTTTDRSWSHMVDAGATMTWEAWDQKYKPNLDWNHAWGAAPANLLPRFVLGVQPLEAGFASVLIAPQPGALSHVEGRVPTIRGPITVQLDQTAARIAIGWRTPANMRAQFQYPVDRNRVKKVMVNGHRIKPVYADHSLVLNPAPAGLGEVIIELLPAESP